MIATDLVQTIKSQVADSVHVNLIGPDRLEVSAPFFFDDGDSYSFAYIRDASSGQWFITDEGDIASRSSYSGVDILAAGRRDRLMKTAEFYGVGLSQGALILPIDNDEFGDAFYTLTQASMEISRLAKLPAEPSKLHAASDMLLRVARIIERGELVNVASEPNWRDPVLDPNRIYDVDYRLHGNGGSVLLFAVSSTLDCWRKIASCQHYRQLALPFAALAVFDETRTIAERGKTAFSDANAEALNSDEGDEIVDFILKKAG